MVWLVWNTSDFRIVKTERDVAGLAWITADIPGSDPLTGVVTSGPAELTLDAGGLSGINVTLFNSAGPIPAGESPDIGRLVQFKWIGDRRFVDVAPCEAEDDPGMAGMRLSSPVAAGDLGAAWVPLNQFDENLHPDRGPIETDIATGRFKFTETGWWDIQLQVDFSHNELNSGRQTNVRLWNVTDGNQWGNTYPIGTGRDQGVTTINATIRTEETTNVIGDDFEFEIGGGDDYTTININAMMATFTQIG